MKTDLKFKLASYMRNRLYKAYKAQNVGKTNKTVDLLKCSHSFFKISKDGSLINFMVI